MTDYLRAQQAFSFRIETSFEIFDSGQKLQFTGSADLHLRRPDRLAIDYRDDLSVRRVWYDGSHLTLLDPRANVYASTEAQSNIDDTLDQLELRDSRAAEIAKLRIFAGLTVSEIANVLGIGSRSVDRQWAFARAWLRTHVNVDDTTTAHRT